MKSMKRGSLISDAKQEGMYFVSSATIIHNGGMKRDGMVFECNITDRTSFDYMMNKLHELADTYDDGTGFYVFRIINPYEHIFMFNGDGCFNRRFIPFHSMIIN